MPKTPPVWSPAGSEPRGRATAANATPAGFEPRGTAAAAAPAGFMANGTVAAASPAGFEPSGTAGAAAAFEPFDMAAVAVAAAAAAKVAIPARGSAAPWRRRDPQRGVTLKVM